MSIRNVRGDRTARMNTKLLQDIHARRQTRWHWIPYRLYDNEWASTAVSRCKPDTALQIYFWQNTLGSNILWRNSASWGL